MTTDIVLKIIAAVVSKFHDCKKCLFVLLAKTTKNSAPGDLEKWHAIFFLKMA